MTLLLQIQQREDQLSNAIAARDVNAASALYTSDAQFFPDGAPTLVGREAITAFFGIMFEQGIAEARFTSVHVEGNDEQASEVGSYELFAIPSDGQKVLADKGRYLVLWRKSEGQWLIHRDMINHGAVAKG